MLTAYEARKRVTEVRSQIEQEKIELLNCIAKEIEERANCGKTFTTVPQEQETKCGLLTLEREDFKEFINLGYRVELDNLYGQWEISW